MKKLFSMLLVLTSILLLGACTPEVDSVFDKSSANRIAESISNTKEILTSAPNGWRMTYYGAEQYGGYNVFCKFDATENVKVMEETEQAEAESHYRVSQSQGVQLSFDTFNKAFHKFSDPVGKLDGAQVGQAGKGFEGDFEFRVLSCSKDSVVLQGKKGGARIVMTPMPENKTWDDYVADARYMKTLMTTDHYRLVLGNDTLKAVKTDYNVIAATDTNGVVIDLPFVYTDKGMDLLAPKKVHDKIVRNFTYSEDDKWADKNDNTVKLLPYYPSPVEALISGLWTVNVSETNFQTVTVWKTVNTYAKAVSGNKYPLRSLFIGTYDGDDVFTIGAVYGQFGGRVVYDYEKIDDNHVLFLGPNEAKNAGLSGAANNNYPIFKQYLSFEDALVRFKLNGLETTYEVSLDDPKSPTKLTLTSTLDPSYKLVFDKGLRLVNFN